MWVSHWLFMGLGLVVLGAVAIAPMWLENLKLQRDHELLVHHNTELESRLGDVDSQIQALAADPQYTERIMRRELNLRKPGEEILAVSPEPVEGGEPSMAVAPLPEYVHAWYYRVFLDQAKRPWLVGLSGGFFLSAILISIGRSRTIERLRVEAAAGEGFRL